MCISGLCATPCISATACISICATIYALQFRGHALWPLQGLSLWLLRGTKWEYTLWPLIGLSLWLLGLLWTGNGL